MSLKPRTYIMLAGGLAIVVGLVWVTMRTDPVPVDLHTIAAGPMRITVDVDGRTQIREVYDVAAPIFGVTRRSPVAVGDPVVAGETLVAMVDPSAPSLLDTRSRIQAEAAVAEAEAALHVAESQLRQAQEELIYAQSQYSRIQKLFERGVAADTQLEDAAQVLSIRQSAVEAARSGLGMAASSLDRARAALIEPGDQPLAEADRCCVRLVAPADGQVLMVDVISSQPVAAGTRLLSIGDPQDLEIVADLLTTDAVRLKPGARTIVERWGETPPLEARLVQVDPRARTIVSALGIDEQRVEAKFELMSPPESRPGLGDEFAVFLRIVEWENDDVLQIPLSAAFRRGEGWAVFVALNDAVSIRDITLGRMNGTHAAVTGGLEPGDRVVTHPSDALVDGSRIVERLEQ